jgi:uncharacterized protein with PQ loop repeat
MFTQFLGTAATAYGVLAALKSLLQTRQMLARRSSRDVSAGFLASYTGGYAIWLAYGLSTGSLPLIVVDTVGLLCAGLTIAVALSLRGSLIRPATCREADIRRLQRGQASERAVIVDGFTPPGVHNDPLSSKTRSIVARTRAGCDT